MYDELAEILGEYGGWTPEQRQEAVEEAARTEAGSDVWVSVKPEEFAGLRVLPVKRGEPIFTIIWKHFYQDATGQWTGGPCRIKMYGEQRCVGCEHALVLRRSPDKDDQDAGFRASAKKRAIIKVFDRRDSAVRLWELSMPMGKKPNGRTQHEQFMRAVRSIDPSDPGPRGRDLILGKIGEGRDTVYSIEVDTETSPLADSVEDIAAILRLAEQLDVDVELNRSRSTGTGDRPKPDNGGSRTRARSTAGDLADEDDVIDPEYVEHDEGDVGDYPDEGTEDRYDDPDDD